MFEHHHLFSLEHSISVRLTEAFAKYQNVKLAQTTKDLVKSIRLHHLKNVDVLHSGEFQPVPFTSLCLEYLKSVAVHRFFQIIAKTKYFEYTPMLKTYLK